MYPSSPITSSKLRLYGRRKGRPLRARKSQLVERLLPRLRIEVPPFGTMLDLAPLFPMRPKHVWCEIGFGGGEHLAAQAAKNPAVGFIGCEPFVNGVASLLDQIDKNTLTNIRIFPGDARLLLDVLPAAMIERCFILFPDPWPKARHASRRFICTENLSRLSRVMQSGARLRLASDDPGMIAWFRQIMDAAANFRLECDSAASPEDWVPTRYEQKALKQGRQPVYMDWQRI